MKFQYYLFLLVFAGIVGTSLNTFANLELIPGEEFVGGSAESEAAAFAEDAARVAAAQQSLKDKNAGAPGRVFHRKINGAALGIFRVLPNLPFQAKGGIFSAPSTWLSLARFSGGVGEVRSDLRPDVLGMALKIIDTQSNADKIQTMDWLMTNSPTAFAKDQRQFIEFMEASVDPGFLGHRMLKYFAAHPVALMRILAASIGPHSHHFLQTYGSGHPYLLGGNEAMKFFVRVDSGRQLQADYGIGWKPIRYMDRIGKALADRNYLSTDLYQVLAEAEVEFSFYIQPQHSQFAELSPLENAVAKWKTEPIKVATITFPKQSRDEELMILANTLGFNPANYLFGHRPVGRMGRGRLSTYRQSQIGRGVNEESAQRALARIVEKARCSESLAKFV